MTGLTRLLAIGQLALVAATWKLWTPQDVFPQVPLIRAACDCPGWTDWFCLGFLVTSSVVMLIAGRRVCASRLASIGMAVSLAGFFILDQHRLQPWAWQFFLLSVLLSLADDAIARRGWMWLVISIYFWSAVSKLDHTFCHVQGPALLSGLKQAMGLRGIPNHWTEMIDIAGAFCFALGELGVALLLASPRTRWLGLWIATIMHVTLLVALGPLGLNHSNGVLLWNVFFIGQDWLLFRTVRKRQVTDATLTGGTWWRRLWSRFEWPGTFRDRSALAVIMAAMVWPLLEPVGLCDHWLAWAVYSGRPGHVDIMTTESHLRRLPLGADRTLYLPLGEMLHPIELAYLKVGDWSLKELGAPNYPQHRFQVGVAWFLFDRFQLRGAILLYEPRNRWTGELGRSKTAEFSASSVGELEILEKTFFWNSRPRRLANQ